MAKVKTVNQNTLVTEIMTVGGVNKENATSIFNIFTNAWNLDRIGMLKAVDTGIVVKTKRTVSAKKAVKKTVKTATKTPAKKKVTAKKAKTSSPVAKVKTKSKGKKKLKAKKAKAVLPATTKSTQTNASA